MNKRISVKKLSVGDVTTTGVVLSIVRTPKLIIVDTTTEVLYFTLTDTITIVTKAPSGGL